MLTKDAMEFLYRLEHTHKVARQQSNQTLKPSLDDLRVISRALEALYIVSTCSDGCHGGDHLHEYLAGRCYNLGSAAFSLIRLGYYDESLNHVRSLGEIANLQSLFWSDNDQERQWRKGDLRARLRDFSPSKVRKKLESSGTLVLMDADTYSHLCEQATHITPDTRPNYYGDDGHPRVGPHQQTDGAKVALSQLTNMLICTSLGFAKSTANDLLFKELHLELKLSIEEAEQVGAGDAEEAV